MTLSSLAPSAAPAEPVDTPEPGVIGCTVVDLVFPIRREACVDGEGHEAAGGLERRLVALAMLQANVTTAQRVNHARVPASWYKTHEDKRDRLVA